MKPVHAEMPQFSTNDSQLLIGGKTLAEIENLVGSTPFYAYDKSVLTQTLSTLKASLPKQVKLHYAIKANPYVPLIHTITPQVDGFDVASKDEMLLALQTGMSATDISFAGPGKTDVELKAAIVAGVTLHCESLNEIERSIILGKLLKTKPNIAVRVNPAFELKTSGMKMSGGAKPFGIDEEQVFELLPNLNYQDINFRGFHIFSGSQNLNVDALVEAHQQTITLAIKLINLTPVVIDYINIGGGLGIPYFPGDKWLDTSSIMNNLYHLLTTHQALLENIDLIMELGRYIVGPCGVYVSKVIDLKTSRGCQYVVCDGGLHHHLANSGNFGQVIRKNYPVAIGNKVTMNENIKLQEFTIVGPLCTPLDIIASKVKLPKVNQDDYIVVYQSGAYGASASPQGFLSQSPLSEIIL